MGKKLQQKFILFAAQILAAPILRMFRATLKIRISGGAHLKRLIEARESFILSFWHENMIMPLLVHENSGFYVLVSQHFDGEIIARILGSFGLKTVRGSSTRGGRAAYQEMKRRVREGDVTMVFTPDGPTGPRRKMKPGVVRLAAETGVPVIPLAVAADRYKRMGSWDKLLLVLPFSRAVLVYGEPFYVNAVRDSAELKEQAEKLSRITDDLERKARRCLNS